MHDLQPVPLLPPSLRHTETSLNAAVDELMQIGLRPIDLSLLTDSIPEAVKSASPAARDLEDKEGGARGLCFFGQRNEGLAALFGLPVYVAGTGAAAAAVLGARLSCRPSPWLPALA